MKLAFLRMKMAACFLYLACVITLSMLFMFVWMERSTSSTMVVDGPEIVNVANQARIDEVLIVPPPPDFAVPPQVGLYEKLLAKLETFDCDKIMHDDPEEMHRAVEFLQEHNYTFPHREDREFETLAMDCDRFRVSRDYIMTSLTDAETEFPIAFNILFHQNVDQLERLLRIIYRPQNQYCIHVDKKTPEHVLTSVLKITSCFPNVFVASKLEIVVYASYTRLLADINCMRDHVIRKSKWRYLINMAASELPIMTNLQMVQVLQHFNGTNDIHEVFSTMNSDRFKKKHFTYINLRDRTGYMIHSQKAKLPPPHQLTITKGNAYNTFSRAFIEFLFTAQVARDLLAWSADTHTPDEHFWATLNNLYSNPFLETPGGFRGHPDKKSYFGRYIGWNTEKLVGRCKARHYVHNVCVFSVQDLPMMRKRAELIANKFNIDYDPIAFRCMEKWLRRKTRTHVEIKNDRLYRKLAQTARSGSKSL